MHSRFGIEPFNVTSVSFVTYSYPHLYFRCLAQNGISARITELKIDNSFCFNLQQFSNLIQQLPCLKHIIFIDERLNDCLRLMENVWSANHTIEFSIETQEIDDDSFQIEASNYADSTQKIVFYFIN